MAEQFSKYNKKTIKNQDQKKAAVCPKDQSLKKQNRKGENPVRIPSATDQCSDFKRSSSWMCKNSACRATLSFDDTFCKRCSCCICHLFDDNKDPSLWVECGSGSGQGDHCGLSCHIECALQHGKVGVVDLGQLMQLDGSYCCAACGKVSGILGFWKKQLSVAKDARRVDILCYRILLCYRLLVGTRKFKHLHEIIKEAKSKLESEVGSMDGVSAKMARGIVSRLSIASDVQTLCSQAIEKTDDWLAARSSTTNNYKESSFPAACRFFFEEVKSTSIVIVLIELSSRSSSSSLSSSSSDCDIKGYKLWYCKTREENYTKEVVSVFPRAQRRILISNLLPCTEYSFCVVSYTEEGDLGHSETKCFTKSREILHKHSNSAPLVSHMKKNPETTSEEDHRDPTSQVKSSSEFKVRDLGKMFGLGRCQEHGFHERGLCVDAVADDAVIKPQGLQQPVVSRDLDLNIASVPDLNEEIITEFSRDEDDDCILVSADDDTEKNKVVRSHGSGGSRNWNHVQNGEVPAVESNGEASRKRAASAIIIGGGDPHDNSAGTLINGSPLQNRNCLDKNFEYCVKIIRWLECEGYIDKVFRLKLLTWFSLRSTEQERRVVNTFIQALIDDPNSLAGQLVDSFSDVISSKKQRNGFCSRLWH